MRTGQVIARDYRLIGAGIYSISEASRLTKVSPWRIRRWMKGYSFRTSGEIHTSPPVVTHQIPSIDHYFALSFLDLLEVKFVDAFLSRGVSWKTLRLVAERGRELVNDSHPFSTGRFWTDGATILLALAEDDPALLDVVRNQFAFKKIVAPFLSQLEFQHDQAIRWWPMGRRRQVVIDPGRSFGQPIVNEAGVPTKVLARAHKVEQSFPKVASWFEVSKSSVKDAVEFEQLLAA